MAKQLRLGPTKGGQERRRKFANDRLVPIRGDRLRAVLRRDQLTVAGFARTHGMQQQTLDYIVRGKTKRCREGLIVRLSSALAVPGHWLTGEIDTIDALVDTTVAAVEDRYVAAFPLAWRDLVAQINDVADRERLPRVTRDRIEVAIQQLTNPRMWSWALFGLDPRKSAVEHGPVAEYELSGGGRRTAASLGAQLDDWLRATLADVFSVILLPWFRNEATLNVRALCGAVPRPRSSHDARGAATS